MSKYVNFFLIILLSTRIKIPFSVIIYSYKQVLPSYNHPEMPEAVAFRLPMMAILLNESIITYQIRRK